MDSVSHYRRPEKEMTNNTEWTPIVLSPTSLNLFTVDRYNEARTRDKSNVTDNADQVSTSINKTPTKR